MITRDELMGLLSALDLVIVDLYELADDQDHPAPYGVLHLDDLSAAAWNAIGGMPVPHLPVGTIVEVVDTIITPDQGELIEANSGPGGDERLGRVEYSADDGMVIRFEDGPDMQVRSFAEWAQLRPALLWESGGGPLADADERENLGTAHPLAHRAQLGVPLVPNPLTDYQHYLGERAAERIAMDRREHGQPQNAALYSGAAAVHRMAQAGVRWPNVDEPQSNPAKPSKWERKKIQGEFVYSKESEHWWVEITRYQPRKHQDSASMGAFYEEAHGQKPPSGTKYMVMGTLPAYTTQRPGEPAHDPGTVGTRPEDISAHRTLAAAKKAGDKLARNLQGSWIGVQMHRRGGWSAARSNPWGAVPEGALATSYNPPPSPFAGRNFPEGALATSYNPPPSPFGRPTYSSGMLQGQSVQRTNARQPLGLSDWDDCE